MSEAPITAPNALRPRELRHIVASSSTLFERLDGTVELCGRPEDEPVIAARLAEWRRVAAQDDPRRFARRLAWDGLDEAAVRRALGPARLAASSPLPAWATTLAELLREASPGAAGDETGGATGAELRFLEPQAPIPFEEILAPLVAAASRRLSARAGAGCDLLAEPARAGLESALLGRLGSLCGASLQMEYSLFRTRRISRLSLLLARGSGEAGREIYQAFCDHMLQGGLGDFLLEYTVLARLIATVAGQWVEMAAELLERLACDRGAIRAAFQPGSELGPVTDLQTRLSDPHHGGRTVMIVTFASGLKVVYKPRDLGLEEAWFGLLGWCNGNGAPLPLRQLRVLNHSTHGWVELAGHAECRDEEEARRYYRRSGMLLCLVYLLGGSDCHSENVIAGGEQPILVDLETVMHPHAREETGLEADLRRWIPRRFEASVLRSGLLPRWLVSRESHAVDVSALGLVEEQETGDALPRWRDVNTDLMEREEEIGRLRPGANAPALRGVPFSPNAYAAEIETGFEQMYRFLIERREELLSPGGPLEALERQLVRVVWRSTRSYVLLLIRVLEPDCQRDGADRSVQLDALSGPFLWSEEKPLSWPLLAAERQALERQDVPYFTASSSSEGPDLAPGRVLEGIFAESSHARVLSHLRELDGRDLERQKSFIRATLLARVGEPHRAPAEAGDGTTGRERDDLQEMEPLAPNALVSEAVAIAEDLRRLALEDPGAAVTWITLRILPEARKFQLAVAGPDLYDGACGIALFLAALEHVTGGAGFRDLALAVLQPLREDLRGRYADRWVRDLGIGGLCGVGAFVYALTRAGEMLQEPALLEDASAAAALITPEIIAQDRACDVVSGSAGAILGLLALHGAGGAAAPLERAAACGHHLAATRTRSEAGLRAWSGARGKMFAGFAHGAAGIAYALLRLDAITGDPSFRDAAAEAILCEDQCFSPAHRNWADLRSGAPGAAATDYGAAAWCHGAPGVALGRLGGLAALDTPQIREDIEAGIGSALRSRLQGRDHLCCGHMGRVEILLEAGRRLSRPELIEAARRRAAWVVCRAKERGSYKLWWETQGSVSMPGMFQGTAGIGYTLLRLAHPDRIPSVLLGA
jgi:type 2 lantibiotic biosynthesis protein LanM